MVRVLLLTLLFNASLMNAYDEHKSRECACTLSKTWLDIVFLFDSSLAVSKADFAHAKNFVADFVEKIDVSQNVGQYSRVGVVNVGSQAHVIGNLTTYENSKEAALMIRSMTHRKDLYTNMLAGLKEASDMLLTKDDNRKNVKNVIVILTSNSFSCSNRGGKIILSLKEILKKLKELLLNGETDPCEIAGYLRNHGTTILTVGMRMFGFLLYPKVDIATSCYALNYDSNIVNNFADRICKANCFCPLKYAQFKSGACGAYGECIYKHSTPLTYTEAQRTCQSQNAHLVDILDEKKDKFLQEEHSYSKYVPYWVGLTAESGEYRWDTGSPLTRRDYSNWMRNQPNVTDGLCVVAEPPHNQWATAQCDDFKQTNYFSCQINSYDTENYEKL